MARKSFTAMLYLHFTLHFTLTLQILANRGIVAFFTAAYSCCRAQVVNKTGPICQITASDMSSHIKKSIDTIITSLTASMTTGYRSHLI
jgi:hypothetical protein